VFCFYRDLIWAGRDGITCSTDYAAQHYIIAYFIPLVTLNYVFENRMLRTILGSDNDELIGAKEIKIIKTLILELNFEDHRNHTHYEA
jgi:hypothetical protein